MRVLIADGDRKLISSLKRDLTGRGHVTDVALTGEVALWHVLEFEYDAVILDVTLPGTDGVHVARTIRDRKPSMPILMLVATPDLARREAAARTIGDSYVIKPFEFATLTAHLDAITQVDTHLRPTELLVANLRLDPVTRQAWRAESELNLSPKEFDLLRLFLSHPGQVLSRRHILEHVWVRDHDKAPNLVDQYVLYLRRKVDRPFAVHQIETVRGEGYRLREQPTPASPTEFPPFRDVSAGTTDLTRAGH